MTPLARYRPLSATEVISQTFEVYKRHARDLVTIPALLLFLPFLLTGGIALALAYPLVHGLHRVTVRGVPELREAAGVHVGDVALVAVAGVVVVIGLLLCEVVATGALVAVVGQGYVSGRASWRSAVRVAFHRFFGLLGAVLASVVLVIGAELAIAAVGLLAVVAHVVVLAVLVVFGGFLALMGLAVALAVLVPVVLVEGVSGFTAIGRSVRLVRPRFWATVGTLLLVYLLVGVANELVELLVVALIAIGPVTGAIGALLGVAAYLAVIPVFPVAISLIYFDLRNREGGIDLDLAAAKLGTTPRPAPKPWIPPVGGGPESAWPGAGWSPPPPAGPPGWGGPTAPGWPSPPTGPPGWGGPTAPGWPPPPADPHRPPTPPPTTGAYPPPTWPPYGVGTGSPSGVWGDLSPGAAPPPAPTPTPPWQAPPAEDPAPPWQVPPRQGEPPATTPVWPAVSPKPPPPRSAPPEQSASGSAATLDEDIGGEKRDDEPPPEAGPASGT